MENQLADRLNRVLESKRIENNKYSLRQFAKDLDINPGSLQKILSGKITAGDKQKDNLIFKLKEKFNLSFEDKSSDYFHELNEYEASIIAHPIFSYVLNLLRNIDEITLEQLKSEINLPEMEILRVIERLNALNLISIIEGVIKRTEKGIRIVPLNQTNLFLKNRMKSSHYLIKNIVKTETINKRINYYQTSVIDQCKIAMVYQFIEKYFDKFDIFLKEKSNALNKNNQVYELSFNLFKIS